MQRVIFSEGFIQYAGAAFNRRLSLLGEMGTRIQKAMEELPGEERAMMQCYYGSMPLSDAFQYDFALLRKFAAHAVWLRKQVEWCRRLPEDIFLQHVAYYRINSESIVDCRAFFCSEVMPLIREWAGDAGQTASSSISLAERVERAVLEINYWCASQASYESTDLRTQSALAVYRSGSGRCGEESTFLVTVLRSVGIAARQVYVPRWAHCDDNHAWVEVYVDGRWHFLGACEPEEMLDRGWFTNAATRALLVYARTFLPYGLDGEEQEVGRDGCARFVNVTEHYTRVRKVGICVCNEKREPVPGAKVAVQILNMAEWASAAWLETDEHGFAGIRIGMGDFLLKAQKDGRTGWRLCRKEETQVCISLEGSEAAAEGWPDQKADGILFCVEAPSDRPAPWPVPDREQKERGRKRLKEANDRRAGKLEEHGRRLRELREEAAGWLSSAEQGLMLTEETVQKEAERIIREKAGCNWEEIDRFLSGKGWQRERLELLSVLSDKDFRDLRAWELEQHVEHSASRQEQIRLGRNEKGEAVWGQLCRADYVAYCLNPRIDREELTAYRQEIDAFFAREEKEKRPLGQEAPGLRESFCSRPECIWEWIMAQIRFEPEEDYKTLLPAPTAILRGRLGGAEGKRVLFAAICRSLGIPARLNPVTGEAEYLEYDCGSGLADGGSMGRVDDMPHSVAEKPENDRSDENCRRVWICVSDRENVSEGGEVPAKSGESEESKISVSIPRLILDMKEEKDWIYYQTWTLGRWNGTDYETLNYEGIRPKQGSLTLNPAPGAYRLIISSRMPNGNQYVRERFFSLGKGEECRIELSLHKASLSDMLVSSRLPAFFLRDEKGEEISSEKLFAGRRSLLAFLETGQEPTEHVLNELLERMGRGQEEKAQGEESIQLILVAAGREAMEYPLITRLRAQDPRIRFLFDEGLEQAEPLARRMYVAPDKLPLLVAVDEEGNGIYASSGYNVGSVELAGMILAGTKESQ